MKYWLRSMIHDTKKVSQKIAQEPGMGQSLSNIMIHLVFSTKGRSEWLADSWRQDLHDYIGGIVRDCGCAVLAINSVADHVHVFVQLSRNSAVADLMRDIKAGSSKWIHQRIHSLKQFKWQSGYGAFSVSPAHKHLIIGYIGAQQEHHKTISFQDEYRRLLGKYEVPFDESYVWD